VIADHRAPPRRRQSGAVAIRGFRPGGTALRWLQRLGVLALATVAAFFVIDEARSIDWPNVVDALRGYGLATVAIAVALSIPGQIACACFDLVGRRVTGHELSARRTMLISYTGYYFSLNLGALIGGLAFRYRLYSPYGFTAVTIGQIIGLSVLTNWSGYVLLGGAVLAVQPPDMPADWGPSEAVLRGFGIILLIAAAAYLGLCAKKGGTRVPWRGSTLELPTLRLAVIQFVVSAVSWASIAAVIGSLLPGDVTWLDVLPVVMIGAIAGIWSHVPGGLGVTEFVFLTLLGHRIGENEVLAGVLIFRFIYYLLPFALAVLSFLYLEATARRRRGAAPGDGAES
jgi:glycosyltransferase 2 family protein